MARGRALATADDLLDPVPRFLQGNAQRFQRRGGDALSLGKQAEQQMLGARPTVTEAPGLVLRQDDDLPGLVGEQHEHVLGPGPHRRPRLILSASGSAGRARIGASFTWVAARPLGRSRGASQSATSPVSSASAASWVTIAAAGPGGSGSMSWPLRARNCSMAASATCWLPRRSGRCRTSACRSTAAQAGRVAGFAAWPRLVQGALGGGQVKQVKHLPSVHRRACGWR